MTSPWPGIGVWQVPSSYICREIGSEETAVRGLVNTIHNCIATKMKIRKLWPGIEPETFTIVISSAEGIKTV